MKKIVMIAILLACAAGAFAAIPSSGSWRGANYFADGCSLAFYEPRPKGRDFELWNFITRSVVKKIEYTRKRHTLMKPTSCRRP